MKKKGPSIYPINLIRCCFTFLKTSWPTTTLLRKICFCQLSIRTMQNSSRKKVRYRTGPSHAGWQDCCCCPHWHLPNVPCIFNRRGWEDRSEMHGQAVFFCLQQIDREVWPGSKLIFEIIFTFHCKSSKL